MEILGLSSEQTQQSQSSQSTVDQATLAGDFQTFMTLLTSQLQNQDPLSPMESNEFTNQLVMFAGVEQQIRINQHLESLNTLTKASQFASLSNYLGHEALIVGNKIENTGSGGQWMYRLSEAAESVTIKINDENGTTVLELDGETDLDENYINWDGTDVQGNPLPLGEYTMQIIAKDANDEFVPGNLFVRGRIEEMAGSEDGRGPLFTVGGQQVTEGGILRLISSGMGISDASVNGSEEESDPLLDLVESE